MTEAEDKAKKDEIIRTYTALRQSLTVVEDMLIATKQALEDNPTPDERRRLDRQILDLEEQRTRINAKMTAIIASRQGMSKPSSAQISEIARLSAQVEEMVAASASGPDGASGPRRAG